MKSLFFTNLIVCLTTVCYGQYSINASLKDSKNQERVPFALVYIDGTTIGVISDEDGQFELSVSKLPVQIEISHISYEHKSILVESSQQSLTINLTQRSTFLSEVVVMDKSLREKYLKFFRKWFLGDDQWGRQSEILNEDALFFIDKVDTLKVEASEPLIIESKALGYKIHADLELFEAVVNKKLKARSSTYIASYHFEDLREDKATKNRDEAYYNSSEHFIKSWYDNRLAENGFIVKKEMTNTAGEKVFVKVSISDALADQDNSSDSYFGSPYEEKLAENGLIVKKEKANSKEVQEFEIGSISSSLTDGEGGIKYISGQENELYYILYYDKNDGTPMSHPNDRSTSYILSTILIGSDEVELRPNGTLPAGDILFSGAMGNKKVGAMLPSDYTPRPGFENN